MQSAKSVELFFCGQVAVNKLDQRDWSELAFEQIKATIHTYLTGPEVGYKAAQLHYVPISGCASSHATKCTD